MQLLITNQLKYLMFLLFFPPQNFSFIFRWLLSRLIFAAIQADTNDFDGL